MKITEILLISASLAMDSFAVSICKGLAMKKMSWKKALVIGLWFGTFQGLMPAIGFILGSTLENAITSIDHWIAFILLGIIGAKMIQEAFSKECEKISDDISFKSMIVLAIATSIDALAVGIAYVCAYGENNAALTFVSIGIITFFISCMGVKIGNKFGDKYEKKAQLTGGLILIILGFKILFEHLGVL